MRRFFLTAALGVLVGCGAVDEGAGDETPSATVAPPESGTSTTPKLDDDEMELVELARSDLSGRLGVSVEEVEVLDVEEVTWPDGSLGCPQPGQMYTQALVEGHRIVLEHDDRVYLYHSGGDVLPFLCESDEKDGGYDFVPPPGFDER
jgi:hypothetical protein